MTKRFADKERPETPMCAWGRGHPRLNSQECGIVRFDLDMVIHRYHVNGDREIQHLMFIEVKAKGRALEDQQRDTLSLLSQVLRNRPPIDGRPRRKARNHKPLAEAFSLYRGKMIGLQMHGGHLLTLSHLAPNDSEWMTWDHKPITEDQLVSLIRFELDPETLEPMEP